MIEPLTWDPGQFEITVGEGDQVRRQTVPGWVDQQKLGASTGWPTCTSSPTCRAAKR